MLQSIAAELNRALRFCLPQVILEMELKDVLNRSNSAALHLDRSVDVSYTEDQMLTALDSMHADSKFSSGEYSLLF